MQTRWWTRALGLLVVTATIAGLAACGGGDDAGGKPDKDAIVYAALGDSFSAGEGAPPYDAGTGPCNHSSLAWPRRLYADAAGFVSIDQRACSGAKTEHMTGPWTSRGLAPQIPLEPDPTVTLVTFTIGGNDVGFGDIVGSCVLGACNPKPGSPQLTTFLSALTNTLTSSVYPALEKAYPKARLVHVGYPRLTPRPGKDVVQCGWLDAADQETAAGILRALDDAIEAATKATDGKVEFVDTTNALAGHELCTEHPWLNPIGLGTGHAHPNAAGQRGIEVTVAKALKLELAK